MSEMIVYCGLDCGKCDAYRATVTNDLELKAKIAERWKCQLGTDFAPHEVECRGCRSENISGWCSRICEIRPCAQARGVETCAECSDYPCEKLERFFSDEPAAREKLEEIRASVRAV